MGLYINPCLLPDERNNKGTYDRRKHNTDKEGRGGGLLYINLCLLPDERNKKLKYGRYEYRVDRKGI